MKEVLEHMSIAQLIDTILINPTVHLAPSYRDTGLSATYTFKPLSNLVYTRDQQARPRLPSPRSLPALFCSILHVLPSHFPFAHPSLSSPIVLAPFVLTPA
jgi:hypothetical protein